MWSVLSGAAVPVHPPPAPTLPAPGPRLVHVSRVALTFPISTHLGRIIGYLVLALDVGGLVYSHKIFVENYDKISIGDLHFI